MSPAKKAAMLKAFDAFSARIETRYAEARQCLDDGRYAEAHNILAALTVSHAKTSLSLKSMLMRDGSLPTED